MDDPIEILKAGALEVGISPQKGAGISHFLVFDGQKSIPLLRTVGKFDFQSDCSEFFAFFPLVPFSGRVRNGQFIFDGKLVQLPLNPSEKHALHGDGWKSAWSVQEKTSSKIVLSLSQPNNGWPWSYWALYTICISANKLSFQLEYQNSASDQIPIGLGFHPWFPADGFLDVNLGTKWEMSAEGLCSGVTTKGRSLRNVPVSTLRMMDVYSNWSRPATIHWRDHPYHLKISASNNLDYAVIYTTHESGAWCFEPVSHVPDAFNLDSGKGLFLVNPNESVMVSMDLEVVKYEKCQN